jgi:dipeptidyl-peptidase-4
MPDSFPRQQARTHRFTLGAPRTFSVSPDGRTVLFLRSASGTDPVTALWALDVDSGDERLLLDPGSLDTGGADLTPEERAQRERRRERAAGVTSYSTDAACRTALVALAGGLWKLDVPTGAVSAVPVDGPVFDARIDPTGSQVAWCRGAELWAAALDGSGARRVAGEDDPDITWGQAEFVAAEEMHRDRGHWWLPGGALLVARVDVGPVGTWWGGAPPPPPPRYPAAGTADADVSLWIIAVDGTRTEVVWDRSVHPYVVSLAVPGTGGPVLAVERRDHRGGQVLALDPSTGATVVVADRSAGDWLEWVPGLPTRLGDGRPVWSSEADDTSSIVVDGTTVTPPGLQVRSAVVAGDTVVFTAWEDPTQLSLWRWTAGTDDSPPERLVGGGVVTGAATGGGSVVVSHRVLARPGVVCEVMTGAGNVVATIASHGDTPLLTATVRLLEIGPDRFRTGVVLPRDHTPGRPLPVLMLPYGGPGAQMVLADQHMWLEAQWRADQGFAVVVCDGRGTPGRGPAWARRVHLDLADGVLADQVTALQGAAAEIAELDLGRVGITGWSFGGFLSALAVLRRPDVFHAAVAGAPVTDWRLYDTYYTEKYLGHPDDDPSVYDRSSLPDDAANLVRPLMLVHGTVDDNVVVAHTLRLSQRLLAEGRAHAVLPLTGTTHMPSQEQVAENLLVLQMGFLADALGVARPTGEDGVERTPETQGNG